MTETKVHRDAGETPVRRGVEEARVHRSATKGALLAGTQVVTAGGLMKGAVAQAILDAIATVLTTVEATMEQVV